ncbi:hypothetical protein RHSIM_Rhsim06G0001500 [Rhododendron simsii]|uniref:Chlorophyll a-b binding protein, chloroplastic n=1 Tax=Rhododendron simsii TaxID=118357 RepID=A0A834LLB1_RHOSS|nr:hypothetical protein RHSIM_Rhsim06G0001500 [Rhododendron simsii]
MALLLHQSSISSPGFGFLSTVGGPKLPNLCKTISSTAKRHRGCRASWQELAGVLVFSAIPFTAVKAIANSPLGELLQRRLEKEKKAAVDNSSKFKALAEMARRVSLWYGEKRPRWLGPIPYDYPPYLTGELPGDYGFDLAGLSRDPMAFQKYFNFEILHARWAMLGALGALIPELLDLVGAFRFVEPVWWRVGYSKLKGDTLDYLGIPGLHLAGSQAVLVIAVCQALLMNHRVNLPYPPLSGEEKCWEAVVEVVREIVTDKEVQTEIQTLGMVFTTMLATGEEFQKHGETGAIPFPLPNDEEIIVRRHGIKIVGPEYARYCGIEALEPLGIYLPGDVNYPGGALFDPLNLAKDPVAFEELKVKEIKNGRLAMVAWLGFFAQAGLTGKGPIQNLLEHISDPFHNNLLSSLKLI